MSQAHAEYSGMQRDMGRLADKNFLQHAYAWRGSWRGGTHLDD
jgi:hypothetical protein